MNGIKNSYPVKEKESVANSKRTKRERISVLNIGQLLFLAFLFTMLLFQSINIYNSTDINTSDLTELKGDIADIGEKTDIQLSSYNSYNSFENNSAATPNPEAADSGIIYVLGEYEGRLAVLSPDKTTAYEVFDIYINTLPAYDKELLHNGIKIRSIEELNSLLEDYNS